MSAPRKYSQVVAEIEKLQAEAAALREQELAEVIDMIRSKVAEFGLTAQDIFGRKRAKSDNTAKSIVPPKYQNPKTGETWSGRGRAPVWIAKSKNRSRFLIA